MSLSSAINSAVSALNAQSSALAMVSNNLANSSTVGYKNTTASFSSILAGSMSSGSASGGVKVSAVQDVTAQGLLTSSSTSTNMAILGSGFFVVSPSAEGGEYVYTRNGEFSVDENGLLQSGGYYLQGWPTDADGNVVGGTTSTNLQTIDTDAIATIAQPTSMAGLIANLPADADVGASFTSALEIYDSLGTAASTTITWTKTGENTWEASFSDPTLSSNASQTVGIVTSAAVAITFNSDGTLSTTNPSPPTLDVTWTTGGAASSITLDMGKAGTSSGLSQYATGSESPTVTVQTSQDGVGFGSLISIAIGDDGTVYANYDNGMQRSIYKVPVATFANANGLEAQSGGVYAETSKSGTCTLNISGTNGAGSVYGSQLELSTTDTNQEFARMMAAQQAYSGAAQVMTAAKDMYDTLMSAVR